jgi:hypothetical protein
MTKKITRTKKSAAIVKAEAQQNSTTNKVSIEAEIDLEKLVEISIRQVFKLFGGGK